MENFIFCAVVRILLFIIFWIFGWFIIISSQLLVYFAMSASISFVTNILKTDYGGINTIGLNISTWCPGERKSLFPLLSTSQRNSSMELESPTGGVLMYTGFLLSLLSELSLVVTRCCFWLFFLLQDGIVTWQQVEKLLFCHLWFSGFSGSQVDQCLYDASQQKGWKLPHLPLNWMDL